MEVLTIQSDRVLIALPPVAFVRREVDDALLGVDSVDALDLPIAVGKLRLHLGGGAQRIFLVEAIEIDVVVTISPTGPQIAIAGIEEREIDFGMHVDPGVGGLGHHELRLAVVGVDEVKIEPILHAIQDHRPQQAIAHPAEARDEHIGIIAQRTVNHFRSSP